MVHRAALAGYGIAWLLEPHVLGDIRAKRLCRLLPDWASEQEHTFVSYPSRRNLPPRTRVLINSSFRWAVRPKRSLPPLVQWWATASWRW